ncbi:thrombospondin type-1 domain-containing protein 4 isoform X1 [Condylostylus longicornis]|uniref:thrombospondin type-1 domain-containing protein 4 isoform X1 n=1 Tax=Condylostylus longicornis TaxID=2530218 RepID=UPI00244DDDAE|nr:thrombospondin type-1 domain-containing protein 4 isoform X1 [Condylostylus longicornis]XP_055372104.1 thrombospondin type-1 domain-containing protein 4 isoform X1 [Condylostylus longicornis]XP_055372105.1 thrombospondin type-1 domain-containing protein 4 isoform X1 [Condylostylus longicornis]XP_055372107.1 thrombospondin type-1 domain-containing protein 4 isoform X1 [Condylostylus longicornis]XP_055372108.1 thrombospondin type-1 domain-containing protein 4 isoform X1 [Condylostylus longicor
MAFYKIILAILAIHHGGVITGSFANSGTIPCGGLLCRPISGIFTKDPLPNEYVHVATLPAGASNISITELKNSKNLLVLKLHNGKYVFNGEQTPSRSGPYEIAGATFDYRRIDGLIATDGKEIEGVTEWITCLGPIRETIELMVFVTDKNPGIKYEYLLPVLSNSEEDENSNSIESDGEVHLKSGDDDNLPTSVTVTKPRRKRRFQWKVVGFSPCSKSCGGGTQTPIIRCVREIPKRFYSAKRCSHTEKPILNENLLRCNTQPCPAYWRIEDWGDCRCHLGEGFREREVRCVQELATGIVIQVNTAACLEEEPSRKKRCECPKTSTSSRRKHYLNHIHHNRNKHQSRSPVVDNFIMNSSTVAPQKQHDYNKSGTWLVSDWNQHCSAECGTGIEYRSIFCDRSPPNSDRCDLRFTPDTTRPCENERSCDTGEWFTSPWSQCSGSCFNLTRNRQVICIRNQLIVEDDECILNEKPEQLQNCTFQDVDYCKPRWHYSSWTECSKSCDGGTQRRTVKCLELDIKENTLKESQRCRYAEREPIYRSCNTHNCHEPRVEMIQNDIATCNDEFSNCHLAVKAKLCGHEYYQQNCCYSCHVELFNNSNE